MKNSIFTFYCLLILCFSSCDKESQAPTLIADLTDSQIADIIKMNYKSEHGGSESLRKFCLQYFKESKVKYDTTFFQDIWLTTDKSSILGKLKIIYRFFPNTTSGFFSFPYSHSLTGSEKFNISSSFNDFELNGLEQSSLNINYDLNKTNCTNYYNSIRDFDIINKKLNFTAKARLTRSVVDARCHISTLENIEKPVYLISLQLDADKVKSATPEIKATIELNEFFKEVLILPNGKKFALE